MADVRLRPRFTRDMSCSPPAVLRAVESAVSAPGGPVIGTVFESSAVVRVPQEDVHFWSPQLQLSIEPTPGGSVVHGLFGPHPTVWSLFVGLYVAIGFAGTMGVMVGCAQWILGRSPWALWSFPAAVVLALLVWIAGRTGRGLGYDQVRMIYDFVNMRLDECEASGAQEEDNP